MAEIDDVRSRIAAAADDGDAAEVQRLSVRYRDLQAHSGTLPRVGRFQAQSGREYQQAVRAQQFRRAGREAEATSIIREMARNRTVAQRSEGNASNRAAAFGAGVNHALLNVGNLVPQAAELVEDVTGNANGRTASEVGQDLQLVEEGVRRAHPVSSGAGEAAGIVASLPAGGAIARGAESVAARVAPSVVARLAPVARANVIGQGARAAELAARGGLAGVVARGGARSAIAGGAGGAAYAAADSVAAGEDDVAADAASGAGVGAAGGAALRGVGAVAAPFTNAVAERLMNSNAVKRIARSLREPIADVVSRMVEYRTRTGHLPTAVEILGERGGREVAATISGHGDAIEAAITRSDDVARQRPAQLASAIENGRPRTAAKDVGAQASRDFSGVMGRVGDSPVSLADSDLTALTTRTARSIMTQADGVLSETGQRIADAVDRRAAAAAARQASNAARQNARQVASALAAARSAATHGAGSTAKQRLAAKARIPALERTARNAADAARDATARAQLAAQDVRPIELSIRELETLRHDISHKAKDGNQYALNELSDTMRRIAAGAGAAGREYEAGLRAFSEGKARAEGIGAGRRAATTPGDENLADALGADAAQSQRAAHQGGGREGIVSGLAQKAAGSTNGARAVATDLAENANLQRTARDTLGAREAERLTGLGRVSRDAAQALEANTPRNTQSTTEEAARQTKAWAETAVVALGHTGGAFKASFAARTMAALSVSSRAAKELADLAFDPARVGEFISLLQHYSVTAPRLRANLEKLAGFLPAQAARAFSDAQVSAEHKTPAAPAQAAPAQAAPAQAAPAPDEQTTEAAPAPDEQTTEARPVSFEEVSPRYLERLAQIESGGDPSVVARTSSATGLYQFTNATWLDVIRRHGAEIGLERVAAKIDDPSRRAAILQLRTDPEIASRAAAALTSENFNALEASLGRDPTEGELYAAHFLGRRGAQRIIQAAERGVANAAEVFPEAARANRPIFYANGRARTAQEVMDVLQSKWT